MQCKCSQLINDLKCKLDSIEKSLKSIEPIEKSLKSIEDTPRTAKKIDSSRHTAETANFEVIDTIGTTFDFDNHSASVALSNRAKSKGRLHLMPKNTLTATLDNGEEIRIIIDSGSSKSLISGEIISESKILSKLSLSPTSKLELYVGNDDVIYSNKSINIPMKIENYDFLIPFQVVPNLTRKFAIIGDDLLSKINAIVELGTKIMHFDIRTIYLISQTDQIIKPGSSITMSPDSFDQVESKIPFRMYNKYLNLQNVGNMYKISNNSDFDIQICRNETIARTDRNYINLELLTSKLQYTYVTDEKIEQKSDETWADLNSNEEIEQKPDETCIDLNSKEISILNENSTGQNEFDVINCPNNKINKNTHQNRETTLFYNTERVDLTDEQQKLLTTLSDEQKSRYLDRIKKYQWLSYDDRRLYLTVNEIIDEKFQVPNTLLNQAEQEKLKDIVKQNSQAFSIYGEIGALKKEVNISFKEHEPFAFRAYPIPLKDRLDVETEVSKLKSLGILEDAEDVIDISPAFAVRKKNAQLRIVLDLRKINFLVSLDSFKSITFDLLIKYISDEDARYISMLDITGAYHGVKLDKQTKRYFGLSIGERIYQLSRLAMGFRNSAQLFERHLNHILNKHPKFKRNILTYIDDICIFTKTVEEHLQILQEVLVIFANEGVKLSLEKCEFAPKEVTILGHLFTHTPQGITLSPLKKRTESIEKIDVPRNLKELRAFLGAANFLSRYTPNFRREAALLYQLTSKKVKFEFTPAHIEAFNRVKKLITSPEVIYLPRQNGSRLLVTDSSEIGYAAVLYDVIVNESGEEERYVIGYDSKSYGKRKFMSSSHHELVALVSAILTFRYWLYSNHFEVYTDSNALVKLAKGDKSLQENGIMLRLWEKILGFSFTLTHKKATNCKFMKLADNLSRLRLRKEDAEDADVIRPVSYINRYTEMLPIDGEEQVLVNSGNLNEVCYYNLRRDVKKPERYGIDNDDANDEETESEPEDLEEDDQEVENEAAKGKPTEFEQLAENSEIPEYMLTPKRHLFEGANPNNVIVKNLPRQIDINHFINDILQCSNDFDKNPIQRHQLISGQRESVLYRDIYRYLKLSVLPPNRAAIRQVLTLAESITMVNDILCYVSFDKQTDKMRIKPIIPNNELALKLIYDTHSAKTLNHIGINSTYKILHQKYYIKNLLQLISKFVNSCIECQISRDVSKQGATDDIGLCLTKAERPFQLLYIDLKKFYKDDQNYEYLLICVDSYTKFIVGEPLQGRTSKHIIDALLVVFTKYGIAEAIISDLESGVNSTIFKAFLNFLNIKITFLQPKAHESNLAERAILKVWQRLKFLLAQKEKYWRQLANIAILSANSLLRKTGYSPYEHLFGFPPRSIKSIADIDIDLNIPASEAEYVENLKQKFKLADEISRGREIRDKQLQRAKHRLRTTRIKGLQPFDLVYAYSARDANYMSTKTLKLKFFKTGPYVVVRSLHPKVYDLITLDNRKLSTSLHSNKLEPAQILVGQTVCTSLTSLLKEIKKQGLKGKEEVVRKLEQTEQSILDANEETKSPNNEDNEVNVENSCIIGIHDQDEVTGTISKLRWKHGNLHVLVSMHNDKIKNWDPIGNYPNEVIDKIVNSKLRRVGSLSKYKKQLDLQ